MTASSLGWSFLKVDPNVAALLHIFGPFVFGFVASWLIYRWIENAGLQSAGFSPIVAATLTTPLLTVIYYVGMKHYADGLYIFPLNNLARDLLIFLPLIVVPAPLLVGYLCGGFRRRRMFGALLCIATVAAVIVEFGALFLLLSHGS